MLALSYIGGAGWQFFDSNGTPLSGGKIYTYAAGTTTPAATYTDNTGNTLNSNPIILNSAGRPPQQIWINAGTEYKFVLQTATDILIWTQDNITAVNSQVLVSTTDYDNQTQLEAASFDWFFMPTDTDFSVTGTITKDFFGPGSLSLPSGANPGDQGGAAYGFSVYEGVTPGTNQHFTFVAKNWTGTRYDRGSAPGQNHVVAGYFESTRGTGSSDGVWALNSITNVLNLNGPTIGYEIDMNNQSGVDPGLNPAQVYHALSLISGDVGRGGTGLVIDRNGDLPNNHWNRGIEIKEIWQRAIEFNNCQAGASGIWTDRTMAFVQTDSTDIPLLRLTPFDNLNPSGSLFYLTNAANSSVLASWLKRGEISVGGNSNQGSCGIGIKGISNGDNIVFLQRNTDTTPAGTFLRAVNAANTSVLFDIDSNATANETNFSVSVSGNAASRVYVGAADSGGTGYRVLRVPN
jgi:hypothetical protein